MGGNVRCSASRTRQLVSPLPHPSDPGSRFVNPANAPLVQIPGTGTIWKISRIGRGRNDRDDDDDD